MPVLVRKVSGFDWGFYSSEEPRMHLQTLRNPKASYKVWLESSGRFVVEPDGKVPAKVLEALKRRLAEPRAAWRVRAEWVNQMIVKDWLRFQREGSIVTLTAYPGTPHAFRREIDLSKHASPRRFADPRDVLLDAETASLVIGARRPEDEWVLVNLADVLWELG